MHSKRGVMQFFFLIFVIIVVLFVFDVDLKGIWVDAILPWLQKVTSFLADLFSGEAFSGLGEKAAERSNL